MVETLHDHRIAMSALVMGSAAQNPVSVDDIDGVIVATTTPDRTFPSVAVKVQGELGIPPCLAFDVQAVCTGFVYALTVADNFIKGGGAKCIGAGEVGTDLEERIVNFLDDVGAGQRQQVVVAFEWARVVFEVPFTEVGFFERVPLDGGAHGTVQYHDAVLERTAEFVRD